MRLFEMIRQWITSDKYLEPGRKVDKWLEKKYSDLIAKLEEKYPEGTIAGVTTDDFDIYKIFRAYKKRFRTLYNEHHLTTCFKEFWNNCMMGRDDRLQAVWVLNFPDWGLSSEYKDTVNSANCIIWNNRKEAINEEFIKEYFDAYIENTYTDKVFRAFKKEFPNSLAEARSKTFKSCFRISETPHLMAIKCFGNLTYKEVYEYFKAALKPSDRFEVTWDDTGKDFKEYKGFPENRKDRYDGVPYRAWINVNINVDKIRN